MSPRRRPIRRRSAVTITLLACSALLLVRPVTATAAPPANDFFADATPVTEPLPFADSTDTRGATLEPDEPRLEDQCGSAVGKSVWYSYAPTADAIVAANTFGSDFDTVLGIWEGTDLGSLSLVGCVDDSQELQSSVVFRAETGNEYRIQVGGYGRASGTLEFHVREATAGVIEGTVTDGSSAALGGICVTAVENVFGESEIFTQTAEDGTYTLVMPPSAYLVAFVDCRDRDYVSEWWEDVQDRADATEIDVAVDSVTSGVDAALAAGCPGFASRGNQILGTAGSDALRGTDGHDVICGFAGDDTLIGLDKRDVLLGGAGDDSLRAGNGRDQIFGGTGSDSLYGGDGSDRLNGNDGYDTCAGGLGHDRLFQCEDRRSRQVASP